MIAMKTCSKFIQFRKTIFPKTRSHSDYTSPKRDRTSILKIITPQDFFRSLVA